MAKTDEVKDYTDSAVNLCNPPDLKVKLAELATLEAEIPIHQEALQDNDSYKSLKATEKSISDTKAQIRAMIEALGSYQDTKIGHYAVKQRRATKEYHADKFAGKPYDQYREAVVAEAINVHALNGLIKGKLLDEAELLKHGVITEKETFAIIIKVG